MISAEISLQIEMVFEHESFFISTKTNGAAQRELN